MVKEIFQMTQNELFDYLLNELNKTGYNCFAPKNKAFIAAKGTIPIVLLAHLDTVFRDETRHDMLIFHDKENGVYWSPDGLGADDRAGVIMILSILKKTKLRPNILFTTDEETNATGAISVCDLQKTLFGEVKYIIELDRQGFRESVYYGCNNKEFEEYVNDFGFETAQGTFTDISIICPNWDVAGVNLSVGYLYEHSYIEHFYGSFWYDTYKKVIKMLEHPCQKYWKYYIKENE